MSFEGKWYNELGSVMVLEAGAAPGLIQGEYHTAVGDAKFRYRLVGSVDTDGDPSQRGQAIAWTVAWNNEFGNSRSVTAWSGQYELHDGGEEEIETLWLLTREAPESQDWAATLVNKDVFTRSPPTEATVEKAKKRMKPHPA